MNADITLLNLNMLYLRYYESLDRKRHVPLGPLYRTRAIEDAGLTVDFRDYQFNEYDDPFSLENAMDYLSHSSSVICISVRANLLPFAILLGGVGPKSVERIILQRVPEVDLIAYVKGNAPARRSLRALQTAATSPAV